MVTALQSVSISISLLRRNSYNIEQAFDKNYNKTCMTSKDSDQPVHLHRTARVLIYPSFDSLEAWHMRSADCADSPEMVDSICDQRRLWSDCASAQSDLSLRWSHKSYCRFFRALAQSSETQIFSFGVFALWIGRQKHFNLKCLFLWDISIYLTRGLKKKLPYLVAIGKATAIQWTECSLLTRFIPFRIYAWYLISNCWHIVLVRKPENVIEMCDWNVCYWYILDHIRTAVIL